MTENWMDVLAAHEMTARTKQQTARHMLSDGTATHEAVSRFGDEVEASFSAFSSVRRNMNDQCFLDHNMHSKSEEISERFLRLMSAVREYVASLSGTEPEAERA